MGVVMGWGVINLLNLFFREISDKASFDSFDCRVRLVEPRHVIFLLLFSAELMICQLLK